MKPQVMNKRVIKLICVDSFFSVSTLLVAFLLRFEFSIPPEKISLYLKWIPWFLLPQLITFHVSNLYARIWRFTSIFDLYAIVKAALISFGISIIIVFLSMGSEGYPRSVMLIYFILNTTLAISVRISVRIYYSHFYKESIHSEGQSRKKITLVGAGKTGEKIAREILTLARHKYELIGFFDDDPKKYGALLHGKKVFGKIKEMPDLNIYFDEILITTPGASGDKMRLIVDICKQTGKRYKTVPGINELIDGEISLDRIRDVAYTDLLGREEIKLDMNSIDKLLYGKRVLITGAGGSIGSELFKQCLIFEPSEIIALDTSEEKIFNIENSYRTSKSKTIIKCVLASVNSKKELKKVFIDNRPQIVFHAAAYKHVPIQELHPWTAVNTNIGGTLNVVEMSHKYSVENFVLVSTDKAVNPVNVMGATKRASEKLIQSFNPISKTTFMAVRFGNVLGSSGSAIPIFQKQVNDGGPITITHPEMTRYFMSIQEASQLILQCGAIGKDGEIFLLEMGKPIKILDLAKDLIRLSGLEPEFDIPIVFTGLRPGEKLYEELQMFNEKQVHTEHKKITILKESHPPMHWDIFRQGILGLLEAAENVDSEKIQHYLKQVIPTYSPNFFEESSLVKDEVVYGIKGQA